MASYVVPQVEIHQLFSEIPAALTQNQVPFIFGPNFLLHRYGEESERADTFAGEYLVGWSNPLFAANTRDVPRDTSSDSSDDDTHAPKFFNFPNALDEEKIDNTYTKVFVDKAIVALFSLNAVGGAVGFVSDKKDQVYIDFDQVEDSESYIQELTPGRMLRLCFTYPGHTYIDTKIVSVDALTGYITIDEEIDAYLQDTLDDIIACEVQNDIEIPHDDPSDVNNKSNILWYVTKGTDPLTSKTVLGVALNSVIPVKINDDDVKKTTKYGQLLSGDVYITYREILDTASDTIHSLRNVSEVADALGAIHPDNPLAQAVYNAALNAGGQVIRYMATPTNDEDGYDKVLAAATLTKEVYFLVPVTVSVTSDVKEKILDRVQSHVNAMSAPTSKRWRIAFVSADVPNEDPIYNADATTDGHDFQALVTAVDHSDPDNPTADIKFAVQAGADWVDDPDTRFKRDLKVGDVFVTSFKHEEYGKVVPQEYMITKILSNSRIRVSDPNEELETGVDAEKAEIYHPYTNAQKAEVIRDLSSQFADRRMYNVFPSVFKGSGVQQEGEFAAACVAGLVSSCLPQQPVTNLELVGIDDIPLVYQTYSYDELNTIASGGTFIVMQDLPNDQVYIRHQISTDYEANNLNTAELSITKNLDSISFYFDALLSPYIGKYNITPELLLVLRNVITAGLTSLESTSWGLYGPQIIAEGTEILLLEQDAMLKDHVNCNIKLNLPYPFNHLVLKLFV